MLKPHLHAVADGTTLTRELAAEAMEIIMSGEATPAQIGALLMGLRMRGETDEELAGFAEVMRAKALHVQLPEGMTTLDTCGTGGDGANTFNISTTAAFVVAGAGVRVAKHGNRAATSRCGSADVLEGLGMQIELSPEQVAEAIERVGIGFMFAPAFHPAMRFAGPVRREIGVRTVFNLLGPITNPAGAQYQVVGVPTAAATEQLARVLGLLGTQRALVVNAHEGIDEIGLSGPTTVAETFQDGQVRVYDIEPEHFGLQRAEQETVLGGDVDDNVRIARAVLEGRPGRTRDIVLLNAGAAIYTADAAASIADGVALARESIDSGAAAAKLHELVELTQHMTQRQSMVAR